MSARRSSQDVAWRADDTFGEAREAERGKVEGRLAVQNHLGDEAAGDGPHREAVTAEAGREHEAAEPWDLAEHRNEIRRGVDVARPASRDPERRQRRQQALELRQTTSHPRGIPRRLQTA